MNYVIELMKKEKEDHKIQISFSHERVTILEEASNQKDAEIKEWKEREKDLRETIREERKKNNDLASAIQ